MFNFATCEANFLFKGKFYDQIDGVAMGSLLAPVLANLFLDHYEKVIMMDSNHLLIHNMLKIFFPFSIRKMRQNNFSITLIQDTLILNLLCKQSSTKLFPFGCPY